MQAAAVTRGLLRCAVRMGGLALSLLWLDNLLHLPPALRLPLALVIGLATGWDLWRNVVWHAFHRPGAEAVALELERRYRVPHNLLINAFQLARSETSGAAMVERTVAEACEAGRRARMADLWEPPRLRRWAGWLGLLLLAGSAYVVLFSAHAWNAALRLALPLADVPALGSVQIEVEPDRDVVLREGQPLTVRVRLLGQAPPPRILIKEGSSPVPADGSGAEAQPMAAAGAHHVWKVGAVKRPFAFRVSAGDAVSRSIAVRIRPSPSVREIALAVKPPDYTGRPESEAPPPPAPVSVLAGSRATLRLRLDRPVERVTWRVGEQSVALRLEAGFWRGELRVVSGGASVLEATEEGTGPEVVLRGELSIAADSPPAVEFSTSDRNRIVTPGAEIRLPVKAADDFGLREVLVTVRRSDEAEAGVLKRWTYLGPPGRAGEVVEAFTLVADPARLQPGRTYILEAEARDFCPDGRVGRSTPVTLRIRSAAELEAPARTDLSAAFVSLRACADLQERARGAAANLRANLAESVAKGTLSKQQQALSRQQKEAQAEGRKARQLFSKAEADGKAYAEKLGLLVEAEMALAEAALSRLVPGGAEKELNGVLERQGYICSELLKLLGEVSEENAPGAAKRAAVEQAPPAARDAAEALRDLKQDLKDFERAQERILEQTRALLAETPQDLTAERERILGALAREEAEWARFLQERLTDFAKLPVQDFGDGALLRELNSVYQEVQLAAKELYENKVDLAVPNEQAAIENAREMLHNIERWLPTTPDFKKWEMEEPETPPDVALAELPAELEDIVGELLDREEDMTAEVEDVTSAWMDSLDKGAGWEASDGPISNMSARGVTGNQLPNSNEVAGRSGEGRTGRSSGQMVADEAEGKAGRATPSRLTPTPFEQGSVRDRSRDSGTATGGGKLSGSAPSGLRGPGAPPVSPENLARLAGRQQQVLQQAEALALHLRRHRAPTGDIENAVGAMKAVVEAAQRGDGLAVRQRHHEAVDSLRQAREVVRSGSGIIAGERTQLSPSVRRELQSGLQDKVPRGYEDIVGEYFRALATASKPETETAQPGSTNPAPRK